MNAKFISLLLLLFSVTNTLSAQRRHSNPNLPDFGDVDKADLQLKSCSFDPEADAEILLDKCEISYAFIGNNIKVIEQHQVRMKVFKDKGKDRANIKLPYYSVNNDEDIHSIKGYTFSLDHGKVEKTKLERKQIYDQKYNDKFHEKVFTLPDIKPGCVFEYEYTKETKNPQQLPDWYFQDEIPTRYSYLAIKVPKFLNFTMQNNRSLPMDIDTAIVENMNYASAGGVYSTSGSERIMAMKDIPGLRDEPLMTAAKDYMQHVHFQLSSVDFPDYHKSFLTTWDKLITELMESSSFGGQLRKKVPDAKEVVAMASAETDSLARMYIIYDIVRRAMNWNGENRIIAEDNVNKVWTRRQGNSTEINIILINLLNEAGIDAYPLLVSTRDHGKVNPSYPFVDQFNQTVAYVWLNGNGYILDATEKYLPHNLTPPDILNTLGYLASPGMKGWVPINENYYDNKNSVVVMGKITPKGVMKANAYISSYNYSRANRLRDYRSSKKDYINDYLKKNDPAVKIDSVKIENADSAYLPLKQIVKFDMPLNNSGDYMYFNTNLFTGLEKNPFIADRRFSDVDFGYKQTYFFTANLALPDGFEPEALPKNMAMILPDTSIIFKRMMATDGHTLSVRYSLQLKRPIYYRKEYPMLKEFYKKLYAKLDEQIVLHKK